MANCRNKMKFKQSNKYSKIGELWHQTITLKLTRNKNISHCVLASLLLLLRSVPFYLCYLLIYGCLTAELTNFKCKSNNLSYHYTKYSQALTARNSNQANPLRFAKHQNALYKGMASKISKVPKILHDLQKLYWLLMAAPGNGVKGVTAFPFLEEHAAISE